MLNIYETHFELLFKSVDSFNFHHSLTPSFNNFIFFGPSGAGKYSQMILFVRNFSPSLLKYQNKLFSNLDKQHDLFINISDIHFEIDMGLLGCNAKVLWHDLFTQIVDFISLKPHKKGFIVCYNFQDIHNELLDVFYSYFNPLSIRFNHIQLKFIILTQHISFIPNNILSLSKIISFSLFHNTLQHNHTINHNHIHNHIHIHTLHNHNQDNHNQDNHNQDNHNQDNHDKLTLPTILHNHDNHDDVFITISHNILSFFIHNKHLSFFHFYAFRDTLYDILIYNIDPFLIFSFITFKLIHLKLIHHSFISHLLSFLHLSLLHFSNNYRSFFHIELIFFRLSIYLLISHHLSPLLYIT